MLTGKVSRLSQVKYTPSGIPILEFTLAFEQDRFGKHSFGYAELEIDGDSALNLNIKLRVGTAVKIAGTLWSRQFRDRQGKQQRENRIIVDKIELGDLK